MEAFDLFGEQFAFNVQQGRKKKNTFTGHFLSMIIVGNR